MSASRCLPSAAATVHPVSQRPQMIAFWYSDHSCRAVLGMPAIRATLLAVSTSRISPYCSFILAWSALNRHTIVPPRPALIVRARL